jgi:hypothetical protein
VTGGRQVPWEVSSLVKPFSFFPGASTATDEPAGEKSAAAWREELKNYSPQEAFDVVVRENRVVVYKEYIALFPQSPFIGQLRGLLDRRLEMWAWFDAVTRGQAAAFEAFLKRYPASDLSRGAKRLLNQAQQNAALAGNAPGSLDLSRGLAQQIVYKDVVKFRDVIKEIPVEKLVYRDVIKFRDVVKEVPVEKIVYKDRIREIKVPVEKVVYVPKVEYKDRVIYKDRIVYKDRVIYKDKIVRVTTPCRCSAPSFNPNGGFNRPIRRHRSR